MKVFSKIKQYPATCRFCNEVGLVIGAFVEKEEHEIAVCDYCAEKLVAGITYGIAELTKRNEEKIAADETINVETTPAGVGGPPGFATGLQMLNVVPDAPTEINEEFTQTVEEKV